MTSGNATSGLEHGMGTVDARRFAEMAPRNGHNKIFFGYSPFEVGVEYNLPKNVTGATLYKTHEGQVQILWTDLKDNDLLQKEGVAIRPSVARTYRVVEYQAAPTGFRLYFLR